MAAAVVAAEKTLAPTVPAPMAVWAAVVVAAERRAMPVAPTGRMLAEVELMKRGTPVCPAETRLVATARASW